MLIPDCLQWEINVLALLLVYVCWRMISLFILQEFENETHTQPEAHTYFSQNWLNSEIIGSTLIGIIIGRTYVKNEP